MRCIIGYAILGVVALTLGILAINMTTEEHDGMAQVSINRVVWSYLRTDDCEIFYPKNALSANGTVLIHYPGVIMLHAGGWSGGNRDNVAPLCIALAKRGAVVVNIDYTLASEAGMPTYATTMADIEAAIVFTRALGCVTGKPVTLMGVSAGGHLAAMYAATATANLPDKVMPISAPVDLRVWDIPEFRNSLTWMLGDTDVSTLESHSPLLVQQNPAIEQLSVWGGADGFLGLMSRPEYMSVLGSLPSAGGVLIPGAGHMMDNRVEQWAAIAAVWCGCSQP
jgi:acetyl esterase/lipase